MKEFEYKIDTLEDKDLVAQLNAMGNKGWEVSSMLDKDSYDRNTWVRFLFKRELVYQRNPMELGPL